MRVHLTVPGCFPGCKRTVVCENASHRRVWPRELGKLEFHVACSGGTTEVTTAVPPWSPTLSLKFLVAESDSPVLICHALFCSSQWSVRTQL